MRILFGILSLVSGLISQYIHAVEKSLNIFPVRSIFSLLKYLDKRLNTSMNYFSSFGSFLRPSIQMVNLKDRQNSVECFLDDAQIQVLMDFH